MLSLKKNTYLLGLFTTSVILLTSFTLSKGTGIINPAFFDIFFPIMISVTVLLLIATLTESKPGLNKIFFFNEQVPGIPISRNTGLKIFMGVLLAIGFSVSAGVLGSPIIDLPQPFTQESLSLVSDIDRLYYQAIIPGFYEEMSIFFLCTALLFILRQVFRNPKVQVYLMLFSAGVGAAVLTQAHRIAYGSDVGAYFGVFLFEFVVQFANMFTGMFISWLPHLVHNGVVSLNFLVAFSVGGVALGKYIFFRRDEK